MRNHLNDRIGFSGTGPSRVSTFRVWWQWLYGVAEPWILRYTDYMLRTEKRREKLLTMKKSRQLPDGVILSTEAVCRFIDFIYSVEGGESARMAVTDCVCQTSLGKTREPRKKDMVLLYTAELYTTCRHTGVKNVFTPIETAEQAKAMVREFHRVGLLHNVLYCGGAGISTFCICNCDDQICVPYRAYMAGRKGELGAGPEIVDYREDACLGVEACGKCLERCVLKASFEAKDKKSAVRPEDCLGCGLCVSTCRGKARRLKPRDDYQHEDVITTKVLLGA